MKPWTMVMMIVLAAGCGGGSQLGGDGGLDDGGVSDPLVEDAAHDPDAPGDPDAPDVPDAEDAVEGDCCPWPMVLNPGSGICVDPTSLQQDCGISHDVCRFGQICAQVWGEGPLGYFCHLLCNAYPDRVCPEGHYCDPVRCCDIPNGDCVPDPCAPPLLYHPMAEVCVSTQGLGMDCSITESCNEGQSCVRYMGVDGGYHFSCEIECVQDDGGNRVCPNTFRCVDYDDGPENICEPMWDLQGCTDPGALVCGLPEKFDGVNRDSVCPGCYGVHFCLAEGEEGRIRYLFPEGALDCESTGTYPCGEGQTTCTFHFRSGVDDCRDGRPSDFFWSTVCAAARHEAVQSVKCFFLE
jgi:hypothetical protein